MILCLMGIMQQKHVRCTVSTLVSKQKCLRARRTAGEIFVTLQGLPSNES